MIKPDLISSLVNGNEEVIQIYKTGNGVYVLVINDDPPSEIIAPHMLDLKTVDWLLDELKRIKEEIS